MVWKGLGCGGCCHSSIKNWVEVQDSVCVYVRTSFRAVSSLGSGAQKKQTKNKTL